MPWFVATANGLTVESIDPPVRSLYQPLRVSITDVSIGPKPNVASIRGRVESGILQIEDSVVAQPGVNKGVVKGKVPVIIRY